MPTRSPSAPQLQEQLRQASGLPDLRHPSMDDVVSRSTSRQRFNMLLMTVFGGAALLLAAIGVYGLMAYSVHQRTQEIGIRLALGAQTGEVRRMVVIQGMRLALLGVAVGIAAAFGLTRLISTFLYGVEARDVASFATVLVLLTLVSLIAVWVPAAPRHAHRPGDRAALRVVQRPGLRGHLVDARRVDRTPGRRHRKPGLLLGREDEQA